MALLPAARVSDAHLGAVLEAALASPGLPLDALRHRAQLAPDPFLAAVRAAKARTLLRVPTREGAGATRARAYPTDGARRYLARAAAEGSGAARR